MSNQDVTFDQLKELCDLYKHTDKEIEITFTKDSISVNITNPIRTPLYSPYPCCPEYNRSLDPYKVTPIWTGGEPTCTSAGGFSNGISDN